MKICIPRKLTIIDHDVRVKIVSNLPTAGRLDRRKQLIEIRESDTKQERASTFMHELIEYCLVEIGCGAGRWAENEQYLITHRELDMLAKMIKQALESAE